MFNFSSINNFIVKSTKGVMSGNYAKPNDVDFFNSIVSGKESLRIQNQSQLFLNIKDKLNFLENKNYGFTVFFPCGSSVKAKISNDNDRVNISISTNSKELLKKLRKNKKRSEEEISEHLGKPSSLSIEFSG